MEKEENKNEDEIDALLNSYLVPEENKYKEGLRKAFENKLIELGISQSKAQDIIGVEIRGLNGLLDGTSTRVDIPSLINLARFLEQDQREVTTLFLESFQKSNQSPTTEIDKRRFIIMNFDLMQLKKVGIIKSTTDFDHIENVILDRFGFDSIFEFKRNNLSPAFSANKLHKGGLMTDYWVEFGAEHLKHLRNRFDFDRKALIDFFPTIRWHSINVEKGLQEVIKSLYKFGISVVFQPKFSMLHVRGATIPVNGKPSILLTNQNGFYPTLWFALIHELHHVLFDWEFIKENGAHVSAGEYVGLYTKENMEKAADKFAHDYLFSDEKMNIALPAINDKHFVSDYAFQNHIHPSIIYSFYAWEQKNKGDKTVWARTKKFMPSIDKCINTLPINPLDKSVKESATFNREQYFKQ